MSENRPRLGVGMVGYSFMGRSHSIAWRTLNPAFEVEHDIDMAAIVGRDTQKVQAAADKLGWRTYETDWNRLVQRDDIDIVDVCTPGGLHAEVSIAALQAGKHVICEKPLANTVDEAVAMTEAAERAAASGIRSMVAFNYRRVPAAAFARQLVAEGKLGAIRHVRAVYAQDFLTDPQAPMMWRLKKEQAGSGALGDIGSHIVDLTQFVTGERITGVSALTETFVKQRPLADGSGTDSVTVDDAALFIARLSGGAVASYEATRFATGRRNALRFEINGEHGSIAFDLERLNELELYLAGDEGTEQGFRRVLVTEGDHPYLAAWWPPGHILGWEHTFTHEAYDFVTAIERGTDPAPSFADGLAVQRVLDAVLRSAENGSSWTVIEA